jgi:PhzF family phenazine biosynthesis protein
MPDLSICHAIVFKAAPGGGNPCPIVFGGQSLSDDEMRSIARTYMEETAFVIPSGDSEHDLGLRYFVPNHEMEMCVHATMGSVAAMATQGLIKKPTLKIHTKVGSLFVNWKKSGSDADRYEVTVDQFLPKYHSNNPSPIEAADALGIRVSDVADEIGPIQSVSTSRPKLMVPLRSVEILDSLKPDFEYLWKLCDRYETTGFYPFAVSRTGGRSQYFARQFPKRAGYDEDPATGVAAAALGAYLAEYQKHAHEPSDEQHYEIRQGYAMGKPGVLHAIVRLIGDSITKIQIRGEAEITA